MADCWILILEVSINGGIMGYPKMVGLQREDPIEMDDWGVPLF